MDQWTNIGNKYYHNFSNPLPSDIKNHTCASDPILLLEHLYLSSLEVLVNLAAPNKRFSNAKSVTTANGYELTS